LEAGTSSRRERPRGSRLSAWQHHHLPTLGSRRRGRSRAENHACDSFPGPPAAVPAAQGRRDSETDHPLPALPPGSGSHPRLCPSMGDHGAFRGAQALWKSKGGSLAEARGLPGGTGPSGRCCIYFLLLVHFSFCVGGSCEQKGDGEGTVREQPVLSNTEI